MRGEGSDCVIAKERFVLLKQSLSNLPVILNPCLLGEGSAFRYLQPGRAEMLGGTKLLKFANNRQTFRVVMNVSFQFDENHV